VAIGIAGAIEYIIAKALIYLIQSHGSIGPWSITGANVEQSELARRDPLEQFQRISEQFPLLRSKLYLLYRELQAIAIL
jgi:hypothetical protein